VLESEEVSTMSEVENFKASKEARAGVVARAARPAGHADVVRRLVDAAFYRETHRAVPPEESTEDISADDTEA
jgi:hypothetical protein